MILSLDHTYIRRRVAVLPENVIEKLSHIYRTAPHRIKNLNNYFSNHHLATLKKNADLLTEWVISSINALAGRWGGSPYSDALPEDLPRFIEMAEFYFNVRGTSKFKEAAHDFLVEDDLSEEEALKIPIKNILSFNLYELESIKDIYLKPQEDPRVLQLESNPPEGSTLFYNDGTYQILRVTSVTAACELARGTKWCTSGEGPAEHYLSEGPLYIIYLKGKKYAQLHIGRDTQLMDLRDRLLEVDDHLRDTFIKSGLMTHIFNNNYEIESRSEFLYWIGRNPSESKEGFVLKTPWLSFHYAELTLRGRFPRGEPVITKNIYLAVTYAEVILQDRWIEVEPLIIKSGRRYLQGYLSFLKRIGKLHEFELDHGSEIGALYQSWQRDT